MKKGVKVDLMKILKRRSMLKRKGRVQNMRPQRPQLDKTKVKHLCGNMFRGRKEGKVVEPLNFFAHIAIKNTQVHTPVPEGTFVGKCQGMERKI